MNRSQYSYIRTGSAHQFRVRGDGENWWVEGTDRNNVWVDAEPAGFRYSSKAEASEAAESLAADVDGGEVVR